MVSIAFFGALTCRRGARSTGRRLVVREVGGGDLRLGFELLGFVRFGAVLGAAVRTDERVEVGVVRRAGGFVAP